MRYSVIGSGMIGATAATLLAASGREVFIANRRGPETLSGLVRAAPGRLQPVDAEEAQRAGDVVLLAIPFGSLRELRPGLLNRKVVVDAMNYYPQRDGHVPALDSGETTSSELVAAFLEGARIVKAFNTIYYRHLASRGNTEQLIPDRHAIFLAGDDPHAKSIVCGLVEDVGFAPVDTGSLREGGRLQQPGSAIYNRPMSGHEAWSFLAKQSASLDLM